MNTIIPLITFFKLKVRQLRLLPSKLLQQLINYSIVLLKNSNGYVE